MVSFFLIETGRHYSESGGKSTCIFCPMLPSFHFVSLCKFPMPDIRCTTKISSRFACGAEAARTGRRKAQGRTYAN